MARYLESAELDDQLIWIKKEMDAYNPNRIAIASLSALERVSTVNGFQEVVIGLSAFD